MKAASIFLQGLGAVAEGLVGGLDVVQGQVIGAQNVQSVEVHAGAGVTHGHVLALQVGNGLDGGVQGDDLDLLHVQGGHGGEAVDLACLFKQVGAVVGIRHNVGLDEAQLGVAGGHGLDVGLGALAHDGGHGGVGVVADLAGQNAAEAIVSTLVTAGSEGQLGLLAAAAGQSGNHGQNDQRQCKKLLHSHILFSFLIRGVHALLAHHTATAVIFQVFFQSFGDFSASVSALSCNFFSRIGF